MDRDLPRRRNDPIRDFIDVMADHAREVARVDRPFIDMGEVLDLDHPEDGVVVQLDNVNVPVPDCHILDHVEAEVGDQVMVIELRKEYIIIGVLS